MRQEMLHISLNVYPAKKYEQFVVVICFGHRQFGALGGALGGDNELEAGRSRVRFPDGVTGIFH